MREDAVKHIRGASILLIAIHFEAETDFSSRKAPLSPSLHEDPLTN